MRGLACLRIAATFGTGTLNRAWPAPVFLLRRASVQARCGGWASVPGPLTPPRDCGISAPESRVRASACA